MLTTIVFYVGIYTLVLIFSCMYIIRFLKEAWKRRSSIPSYKQRKVAPSCLNNPTIGEHRTIILHDRGNLDIHYVENGSTDKPLMLFLHGFPDFWYGWRYQLKEFGNDCHAVAIDLPGCGSSSKPEKVWKYHMVELAKDVKACIKELGHSSCILVGHDWGGGVAYKVAGDYPELVDKLIILNTPHPGAFFNGLFTLKQLMMSSYMFFFQYVLSFGDFAIFDTALNGRVFTNLNNLTKEDLEAYKFNFQRSGLTCPLNFYRMAFEKPKKELMNVPMRMPSIIIWGTGDQVLSSDLAAPSAKYFDNIIVKYLDGTAHWPHVDRSDTVNTYMKEFLDS